MIHNCRHKGRSRSDQTSAWGLSPRDPQAYPLSREDADYPCPNRGRTLLRLPYRDLQQRSETRSKGKAKHQWTSRTTSPHGCHSSKMCSLSKYGKPVHRKERTDDTVYSIITQFQQEFRGFAEYYQLAVNRYQLNRLKWVMERSLVATLAHKLRISVSKVYDRYETTIETPDGPRKVLQVTVERKGGKKPLIARWGGISLARNAKAILKRPTCPRVGRPIRTRKTAPGRHL